MTTVFLKLPLVVFDCEPFLPQGRNCQALTFFDCCVSTRCGFKGMSVVGGVYGKNCGCFGPPRRAARWVPIMAHNNKLLQRVPERLLVNKRPPPDIIGRRR